MASPLSDTKANFANCSPKGCVVAAAKVHYRFQIKLLITAMENPNELAKNLFKPHFSLHNHVTVKSRAIPLRPTIPNLATRSSIVILPMFTQAVLWVRKDWHQLYEVAIFLPTNI